MADRTLRFRIEGDSTSAEEALRRTSRESEKTSRGLMDHAERNKQAYTTLGLAMGAFGAAAGAGLMSVVRAGGDFQQSMNQVKAVSGATGAQFGELNDLAKELGASTRYSASEAAQGMGFLAMAGFETTEIMSAMPGVLELAAAGAMDLGTAADIASNVLTGYGMTADEITRVNDVMAKTFTTTNTDLMQLGEAMKYAAPVASAAGVQFEEAAAAIGLMGNAGIQGSMAGTSLRGAISRLLSPTEQAASIMADLGLQATNADGSLVSLEQIVRTLEESGATTADMMQLFGQRAGPAMAALVSQGADALRDQTAAALDSAGTAAEIAETQMEGLNGAIIELKSAAEGLKIALFESGVGDFAENVVDSVTGVIRSLEGMPRPVHTAVMGMTGLAAVGGTVGGAFLLLLPRIAETRRAMEALNISLGAIPRTMLRWAPAIGGATLVLGEFMRRSSESAAALRTLQEHLDDVASGADLLSDAWLVSQMKAEGVYHTWEKLGIPLETLRQDLRGNAEATAELEAALQGSRSTFDDISDATNRVTMGLVGSKNEYRELHRALGNLGIATEEFLPLLDEQERKTRTNEAATGRLEAAARFYGVEVGRATDATGVFGDALDDVEGEVDDTRTAIERLMDALDILVGVNISAERAAIRLEEGYVKLRKEIKDGTDALNINTEKGRENRTMILDQVDAIMTAMEAEYNRTGSMYAVGELYDQHVGQLRDVLRQAGLTEDQVDSYIESLGLTPEQIHTTILSNADEAITMAERVAQALGRIPTRITTTHEIVQTQRTIPGKVPHLHTGGYVGQGGGIKRYHGGGQVGGIAPAGLRYDEVPAILQTGEMVLSRQQVAMLQSALGAMPGPSRGGDGASAPAPTGPVTLSERSIADLASAMLQGSSAVVSATAAKQQMLHRQGVRR